MSLVASADTSRSEESLKKELREALLPDYKNFIDVDDPVIKSNKDLDLGDAVSKIMNVGIGAAQVGVGIGQVCTGSIFDGLSNMCKGGGRLLETLPSRA